METLLFELKSNVPGVISEVIDDSVIQQKDLLVPILRSFKGTMRVHQAVWDANDKYTVALRSLSCASGDYATSSVRCDHGKHVGFYYIEQTTECVESIPMQSSAALNNSPAQKVTSLPVEKKSNAIRGIVSDYLALDSDDSFWVKVTNDDINITPSTSNALLSSLNKKSYLDWDSDDENIF